MNPRNGRRDRPGDATRRKTAAWSGLPAVALALWLGAAPAAAATAVSPSNALVFAGNGGSLPAIRALAAAFARRRPDVRIDVPASLGSSGGIRAVSQGAITVALTARPLAADEQRADLRALAYGRTPVVAAVHAAVPDSSVTDLDLRRILEGAKSRWSDGEEIILFLLRPDDTLPREMTRAFPALRDVYEAAWASGRWTRVATEDDMNIRLAETRGGVGIAALSAVLAARRAIKALTLNGVAPGLAEPDAGRYPTWVALHFVFKPLELPPQAKAFIDFARSAEGRRLLLANGVQPIE